MWDAGALGVASRHEVGHPVVAGSSVLIATSLPSVGAPVSGSPSQYDHRCSPVSALIATREDRARLGVMRSAAKKRGPASAAWDSRRGRWLLSCRGAGTVRNAGSYLRSIEVT